MTFKESTSLLGGSGEGFTEFQRFLIHFKKYLLLPICIFIPIIVLYTIIGARNDGIMLQSTLGLMNTSNSPYIIPEIEPIDEIIANGSVRVERFHLTITRGVLSPINSLRKEVYLVNGRYPGPAIRIQQNSILILTVTNNLNISITIHLHGIHQRGTYLSDGVPLVTQDPIKPGDTFTHTVNTWPQAGTFFYHAHTGMDIMWISGPLIIEDDPKIYTTWPKEYQYDDDRIFFLNGIYHQTFNEMEADLTGPVFSYPRVDFVTMNGKGHGLDPPPPRFPEDKEDEVKSVKSTPKKIILDVTAVKPMHRYRLRFISSISDGTFSCKIAGHTFTVIEMDGIYSEPIETDRLVISPGQRYSVLVTMDQALQNEQFVACKHLEIIGPTGLGIVRYAGVSPRREPELKVVDKIITETVADAENKTVELQWILDKLKPNFELNQTDVYKVPENVDQEFLIDVEEVKIGPRNSYLVNGHHFQEPNISYHHQLSQSINITDPPQVYEIRKGEVIQIIFQNQRLFSICFGHPWHLHGHSFHVVGSGPDQYNPLTDGKTIKENVRLKRSMEFRDTVTLNGAQTAPETERPKYCGWTAIRFVANNPGIWLVHCHVTPHMIMGKRFILWEHSSDDPYLQDLYLK